MIHLSRFLVSLVFISLLDSVVGSGPPFVVPIGVILDSNSPTGSMAELCMKFAVSDIYEAHPNFRSRLDLRFKSAETVLDSNFAAIDFLKPEDQVHGLIGPQGSTEESFFAELGRKARIPILSIASTTSSPHKQNNYFFRSTPDDSGQARALAAVCRKFEWSEVAVLYEDTDNGNRFVSYLNSAFREVEIGLAYMISIPTSAEDDFISRVVSKLSTRQARVFVVHVTSPALGFQIFRLAKLAGAMSEGYAWLTSHTLPIFMDSVDHSTRDSMEGVVGVRPYIPRSKELDGFERRWKRNSTTELNVYGLWAYDAMTALAMSVEKAINGTRIIDELSRMEFRGLTGDFRLVDGRLKPSAVEVFNVVGTGEKTVGFWTTDGGLTRELGGESTNKELKSVTWPGDSVIRPKGWAIPNSSGVLRVGVPWKLGYTEFVDVTTDRATNHTNATGFSIDIFLASLDFLPFRVDYEFSYYNDSERVNWSYDDMLLKIPQDFDMVVGDTTIWAPRARGVDFSTPYSESGVILVVKNRKPFDMWIFLKPLRWDLWLAIFVACVVMGIVLRILEHRVVPADDTDSPRAHKKRRQMIHLSPVAVLAFPERNMVSNNWSFIVLLFWLFMAFILMQSYTANLSAILTVDQLKFAFSDDYYVGYQDGSFMKEFLIQQLHISESRLRSYTSAEEYHEGMSKGSRNGGIDAVFDEIPYMKIFLKKYDSQYKMVGPTYRTGGFGFAFPLGSPLAAHFSRAILDVTQGPNMTAIEQKNFGPGYSSQDPLSSTISQGASSLSLHDFAGLFIIVGSVTVFALFCSETAVGRSLSDRTGRVANRCFFIRPSRVSSVTDSSVDGDSEQGREDDNDSGSVHGQEEPQETGPGNEATSAAENSGTRDESHMESTS